MRSWPSVFLFGTFLNVVLYESMCMFASIPSWSSNSFFVLFIHSVFLLCFSRRNCFAFFTSGCWFVILYSPPTYSQNSLFLFWKVLFCLYCLILSRYLSSYSSLTISSSFIFWTVCYCFVFFFFFFFFCLFLPLGSAFISSSVLSFVVPVSLFVLLASFHIQILFYCWRSFGDYQFLSLTSFVRA